MITGKKYIYRKEAGEADAGGAEDIQDDKPDVAPEVEDKARRMGWTPKDEFRGDPDKWRSAKEFVDRGENMLPIMRDRVQRQETKIAELERTVREFADFNSKADQRAYERAFKDLKTQQIQAVAAGDAEGFMKVDQAIEDLRKEAAEKPKMKAADPGEDPEYQDWEARNKWVTTDKEAKAYAESYGEYLRKTGSRLTGADFLDEVTKAVKKEFPAKFSNPRRESAPSVEGGIPRAKGGGKGYADLPGEAKAACDRFVKNSGGKMTREMYTKQYFDQEE